MGVLQRLAITYFFTSLLHLAFDKLFFIRKKNNLLEKDNGKRVLKENLITKSNYYCLSNNQLGISKKYLQYINYGLIVQIFVIFIFISIYILFAYCFNVPDCGRGKIDKKCFAGSYIDRIIFGGNHLWVRDEYDPEGLVSSLTATYPFFIGLPPDLDTRATTL